MTYTLAHSRDVVVVDELPPTGDVIEVDELRLRCVIGVNREERRDRQDVVISLRIGTDARVAAVTDCVDAVWNYRTATKAIIGHGESSSYLTVEKLASEIARIVVVDHAAMSCPSVTGTAPQRCSVTRSSSMPPTKRNPSNGPGTVRGMCGGSATAPSAPLPSSAWTLDALPAAARAAPSTPAG